MTGAPHRIAGIIGGMGPEATVEFMRRILVATPAADDGDHVHLIVDSHPKIPSRIAHLIEGTGPDPTPELVRIARNLERAGADCLAMPCNTAHGYATAIQAAVSIPLLNMVNLTVRHIEDAGARRVGLLASSAVHASGVYARALERRALAPVVPARQDELMALIKGVKRGATGTAAQARLAGIAGALSRDCDILVIACSELSLLTGPLGGGDVRFIDSLDVLTTAVLEFVNPRAAGP